MTKPNLNEKKGIYKCKKFKGKKKILVNALVIKVCKCNAPLSGRHTEHNAGSENCVTKMLEAL